MACVYIPVFLTPIDIVWLPLGGRVHWLCWMGKLRPHSPPSSLGAFSGGGGGGGFIGCQQGMTQGR